MWPSVSTRSSEVPDITLAKRVNTKSVQRECLSQLLRTGFLAAAAVKISS